MALEQNIANLVEATNKLTQTVDEKMQLIDQRVEAAEQTIDDAILRMADSYVKVISPIYKTIELGASGSTGLISLGLNAKLAVCSVFVSSKDTDYGDHFNLQIGKGANSRRTWGPTLPSESVNSHATVITHIGDNQSVLIGHYGMYLPATVVLDDNGDIPLAVVASNAGCGVAINITALIGER